MRELKVGKNDAGQRLDRFIMKAVPLLPAGLCQKYIRMKRIKVNNKGGTRDYRLREGDTLELYLNDEFFDTPGEDRAYLRIKSLRLEILYEDKNILLLDKKPGVLCHAAGNDVVNTLISNVQAYLYNNGEWQPDEEASFTPALCNRIDRNTGGIVIAAKNADSLRTINDMIKNREIGKYYLCVCRGIPNPKSGAFRGYIFKDAVKNRVYVRVNPEKGSKYAETEYRVISEHNGLALCECKLVTGRTHQIRAQFAAAGCPLLGDGKYGYLQHGDKTLQALYSYKLIFPEKTTGTLSYLSGKHFEACSAEFVEKYFESGFMD